MKISKSPIPHLMLFLFLLTALITLQITVSFFPIKKSSDSMSRPMTVNEFVMHSNHYIKVLKEKSPGIAVDELMKDSKKNNLIARNCHPILHELGRNSYNHLGSFSEAVKYRTESCNSGYIHGVIEAYFSEKGDIKKFATIPCQNFRDNTFLGWQCFQ